MKLKAKLDTLDGLDENLHQFYVEQTVGDAIVFVLDVDGIEDHPGTNRLKVAFDRQKGELRDARADKATLAARLDGLPDDFDAESYDELRTRADAGGKLPNEEEVRTQAAEAATRKAEKAFAKERETLTTERDKYKSVTERSVRKEALDVAFDEVKIEDPAYRKGARALHDGRIIIKENDGEFVALYSDPDLGDIPVTEAVKAWADTDEGKAYVGARETGGGGSKGPGGGNPPTTSKGNPWKRGPDFNATRQAEIKNSNLKEAQRLMREAGLRVAT